MRRIAISLAIAASIGCIFTIAASAEPTMSVALNDGGFVMLENPGGELLATTTVDPDDTTPLVMYVSILDPNSNLVYEEYVPEATYHELAWTVPPGLPDGQYEYQVEYWSLEGGLEIATGDRFYISGATPGFCARKFLDLNGNGELDAGEEIWIEGIEICYEGPAGGDCKLTDEDGAACWFFLATGDYTVCVNLDTLPPGFEMTTDDCIDFTLGQGDNLQFLFGCWEPVVPTQQATWGSIKATYR